MSGGGPRLRTEQPGDAESAVAARGCDAGRDVLQSDEDSAADAQALTAWGVEAFVGGVSEALPSLRWGGVFEALDQPTWAANGPGADGFALLVALHRRACSGPLPAGALLGGWTHSGAQLRLLAHVAGVKTLQDAFNNGIDIHRQTASQVFGVPVEEVTSELRSRAKAINFGIIYGQSATGQPPRARRP